MSTISKKEQDRLRISDDRKEARAVGINSLQLYLTEDQKKELLQYLAERNWKTQSARAALTALLTKTMPPQHVAEVDPTDYHRPLSDGHAIYGPDAPSISEAFSAPTSQEPNSSDVHAVSVAVDQNSAKSAQPIQATFEF